MQRFPPSPLLGGYANNAAGGMIADQKTDELITGGAREKSKTKVYQTQLACVTHLSKGKRQKKREDT